MDVAELEGLWQPTAAVLAGVGIAWVASWVLAPRRRRLASLPAEELAAPPAPPAAPAAVPRGGMGLPFRRRGPESLRIQPSDAGFHVLWRVGETAVAHLCVTDELAARGLYEWVGRRFGTAASRLPTTGDGVLRERVVHRVRQRRPVRRKLTVIERDAARFELVDIVEDEVRARASLLDESEALELVDLLGDVERARALAARVPRSMHPPEPQVAAPA